jgi:hypothetical protein
VNLPGWTCSHCHAFHGEVRDANGVLQQGERGPDGGKLPRTSCRSCGAERFLDGFELIAGLALADGEMMLMRKKIKAYEVSERAYKAEIDGY